MKYREFALEMVEECDKDIEFMRVYDRYTPLERQNEITKILTEKLKWIYILDHLAWTSFGNTAVSCLVREDVDDFLFVTEQAFYLSKPKF